MRKLHVKGLFVFAMSRRPSSWGAPWSRSSAQSEHQSKWQDDSSPRSWEEAENYGSSRPSQQSRPTRRSKGGSHESSDARPPAAPLGRYGKGSHTSSAGSLAPRSEAASDKTAVTSTAGTPAKKLAGSWVAQSAAESERQRFKVYSEGRRNDTMAATLVGDYEQMAMNHGKKVYKKIQQIGGHEDIDVYLYYWDTRDGADYSGWWFGEDIGGAQVWAHVSSHATTPPKAGWRLPWDAPSAVPGVLVVEECAAGAAHAPMTNAGGIGPAASTKQDTGRKPSMAAPKTDLVGDGSSRLKKAVEQVDALDKQTNALFVNVRKTCSLPDPSDSALKGAVETMEKQQTKLNEMTASLTKDLIEVRKSCPSSSPTVTEMSKLVPKIRAMHTAVLGEFNKVKVLQAKLSSQKHKEAMEKKQKEDVAQQKKQDEQDAKDFQPVLASANATFASVEAAVEKVVGAATPLLADPPVEGKELNNSLMGIEVAAADAQKKVTEARNNLNVKIANTKKFSPELRKKSLAELGGLQGRIGEMQNKLNPFKSFKQDFAGRVKARQALMEIGAQFHGVETETEKASGMCRDPEVGLMTEVEVGAVEKVTNPVHKTLVGIMQAINQRSKGSDSAMRIELDQMKVHVAKMRSELDKVIQKVRAQRDGLNAEKGVAQARDKVDTTEKALEVCHEAEMPFLKGIEVLPKDESDVAIAASEKAASNALAVLNQAKIFLEAKRKDASRCVKDLAQSLVDQLAPLAARLQTIEGKLEHFFKETGERKMAALLADAVEGIVEAEKQVNNTADIVNPLSIELESISTDDIKEIIAKARAAEKEATAACAEAGKVLAMKKREARGPDAVASLGKVQARLNASQEKLGKQHQTVAVAEKFIKTQEALVSEAQKLKQAQNEIEKVEQASIVADGEELSGEAVQTLVESMGTASALLRSIQVAIQPVVASAPPATKVALEKLLEQRKSGQDKIDKIRASTKEPCEKVLSVLFVKEGEDKLAAVEAALEAMADAELPFLKGIEVLPLQEASATVAASEKAASAAQDAINEARTYIAVKATETRSFDPAMAKVVGEGFAKLTGQINIDAQKLVVFRKETESRKRTAQIEEATEKVSDLEELVKKLTLAADPFMAEDAAAMTEEEAAAPLEQFLALDKEVLIKLGETRGFVSDCQRISKDNPAHVETLKTLQTRLAEAQAETAKLKKATINHEQRFLAKRIVEDATEKIATLDGEIKSATEACASLLVDGGEEFLVGVSIRTLAFALRDHLREKDLTEEALFQEVGKGDPLNEDVFVGYLKALPQAIGREELGFTDERRLAIFKRIDGDDKDGVISLEEFKAIFRQRSICMKEITITDGFDIADSKVVAKVAPGDEIEIFGIPKIDSAEMLRSPCRILPTGDEGWITVKGNQGTVYVDAFSPFNAFAKVMDQAIATASTNVNKVSSFLAVKLKEGGNAASGSPLSDARLEITKLRTHVSTALSSLETLRKKVSVGKKDYAQRERSELNAHIEARERKDVEEFTSPAEVAVTVAEEAARAIEDSGKRLVAVEFGADVEAIPAPRAILESVEKLAAKAFEKIEEARTCVKDQFQASMQVNPPTRASAEAKRVLQRLQQKVESDGRFAKKMLDTVRERSSEIARVHHSSTSRALREEMRSRHITGEQMFDELSKGNDRIAEDDFTSKLASLKDPKVSLEHIKLLYHHIQRDGICRRRFLSFVQLFFTVVKDIALTDQIEISKCKTIRKAEKDEIIEVLRGPDIDENSGLQRIWGKSLRDGSVGWITLRGNAGTPFLREVEKPYITCRKVTPLEKEFKSDVPEIVRTLNEDEILEVIEGPRKETTKKSLRARINVMSDEATGWVTLRDRCERNLAEIDAKLFICTQTVAITDGLDVKSCNVLRKLVVGELFEMEGELVEDPGSKLVRAQGKALKDGKEGWISTKGNAGTIFAEVTNKYYSVLDDVQLHTAFSSEEAKVVRTLTAGEKFQVVEGPKEETVAPEERFKVCALSDRAVGWISQKGENIKAWTPYYKCLVPTSVHDACVAEGATILRESLKNEVFELLQGPVEEGKALRIKGRAVKDGIFGWVSLKDCDNQRLFDC
eukprot:TRINITY_DN61510_c0_g1_i1.p1 TRINITY_DN61510_c0_g1~~TRINITY_DN61510_c0_g1_i1.p1  ORF type:complete len:2086 (-),score=507.96 TRINITY_DN61510_c0_g1_i1:169-6426(-)